MKKEFEKIRELAKQRGIIFSDAEFEMLLNGKCVNGFFYQKIFHKKP